MLVCLEHEMRTGRGHAFQRSQLFADESGDLLQGMPFDEQEQIEGPGNQVQRSNLAEGSNPTRDRVETILAFGCDLDLDQCRDRIDVGHVLMNDGLIAANDTVLLVGRNLRLDIVHRQIDHSRDVLDGFPCVVLKYPEDLIHIGISVRRRWKTLAVAT